ncbi:MAG: HAD-IA family hydrolase [Rhodobacteraceae bacterium]|nr:HAD-IA family hydrolase [Paracoccaceae bacterium]
MSELKLVIFDMDGTLIDSQAFIQLGMGQGFARAGYPAVNKDDVLSIVGLSFNAAVAVLLPTLDAAENQRVVDVIQQTFYKLRDEMGDDVGSPLYPGARDTLERLHLVDEILMGVATGKARRGLDHAYNAHKIEHFFITSQTADLHPSKPHPSMLHQTLKDTGVEAAQAVMVGDTEFDMEMGRAAGFKTVGVSWGYHPVSRLGAADVIIDDFADLDAALAEMWS